VQVKRFDNAYFDKWYRHPKHRVGTRADLTRMVRFAVTAAEYVLARPVRSVLDVGAGEGRWQPILRSLRPSATYQGVDPSEYVVRRYGRRRNIVRGTLDDLETLFPRRRFDLVVSCSVFNYLDRETMTRGLRSLAARTGGLAYVEIFTADDNVEGDTAGWHAEPRDVYRRTVRLAGLIPCGLHCYIPADHRSSLVELELA
jgi:SAM-dependent methyltransferase